jgi:glyoxylase-like metal-dependent hydrolase (beta-lactamase superfamily II)
VTRVQLASRTSRLFGYTVSVYLAEDGAGGVVLVDTGLPRAWRGLVAALRAVAPPGALRGALVTHAHEDHAGNVAALAAAGVPLAMGALTRARLAEREAIALYRRATWGNARARSPATRPPSTPRRSPSSPRPATRPITTWCGTPRATPSTPATSSSA